ncbi:hypothetical protein [Paenibacillus senegalensis]|uniref:hypothetical protein n=1 Tax=Paenibacillus senegalensis TaxID=1465766 RepID=UPI000289F9BF|nr:hypothetical protein [Paenibacillus senegalensis]
MRKDRQSAVGARYSVAGKQLDQISDSLQMLLERKRQALRVSEFLARLANDPGLSDQEISSGRISITEWIHLTKYPLKKEMVYNYDKKRFEAENDKSTINFSLLLTLLLQKQGLNCTSEELMEHVLQGGSVDEFLQKNKRPITIGRSGRFFCKKIQKK